MHTPWAELQPHVRTALGSDAYATWIEPLVFSAASHGRFSLLAPSSFIRDFVLSHYKPQLLAIWRQHIDPSVIDMDITVGFSASPAPLDPVSPIAPSVAQATGHKLSSPIDPSYSFDNFVVDKSNEFAYGAAKRVASTHDSGFNPLFIYGGVGLGKTHLMHAIALDIKKNPSPRSVIYLSAEKFMHRFIQSLQDKNTLSFKEIYRTVDVLMVDDVQFLGGKDSTQEEFFHTFNALMDQGKQIVLSADRSPSELEKLEKRLISRMQKGLVADIHRTTYELRLGILHKKVSLEKERNPHFTIPDSVLVFLAHRITSNVRELEGALRRITAIAELTSQPITLESAQHHLEALLRSNHMAVGVDSIQRKVCAYYKIKLAELLSPNRSKALAHPRQVAMYLCKELTSLSYSDIGRQFSGRDHTTVIYAVDKIKHALLADPRLEEDITILLRILEN